MQRIADYALISNCNGSALVGRDGSIDWACLPRFDSPAVFARILDERAGHWRIAPADGAGSSTRAYVEETMVLRTEFHTPTGAVAITDAVALAPDERGHRIGRHAPPVLLRVVEGVDGEVSVVSQLDARPEYGLTTPVFVRSDGALRSRGGPQALTLHSTGHSSTCTANCSVPRRSWRRRSGCSTR